MDNESLTSFYDRIKSNLGNKDGIHSNNMINVGGPGAGMNHPGAMRWRSMALNQCDKLKDKCCKHIILDIYCNILPLDDDYKCGHHGQMKSDIDSMLDNKGMNATQYLTSCKESTNAPLLEFVLRSIDYIGKSFMEEADKALKDAQDNNIDIPAPEADENSDEVESQLVDIKSDPEYETFIDKLKQKTINKIVTDVSKIITDNKEKNNMKFDPQPATESTVEFIINHLQSKVFTESGNINPETQEAIIGLAIREATLNQLDVVFNRPGSDDKSVISRIRFGKGNIINESTIAYLKEEDNKRYESLYKEVDGNKYDVSNYEKVDKDGKRTPMSDDEAKKVLDPDGYKGYQNRNKK